MNKQNPIMSRVLYALGLPFVRYPKTSLAVLALLLVIAVGMFTGWGPRNAQGWPFP